MLMAMLILGLGGFGVTNFGGGDHAPSARSATIEITTDDYARALQHADAAPSRSRSASRCRRKRRWPSALTGRCCTALVTAPRWTTRPRASAFRSATRSWRPRSWRCDAFKGVSRRLRPRGLSLHAGTQQPDRSRVRNRPARATSPRTLLQGAVVGRLYRARAADRHAVRLGRPNGAAFPCCG